jgi:putative CRISPR-associated protein (TIGR02619 family)
MESREVTLPKNSNYVGGIMRIIINTVGTSLLGNAKRYNFYTDTEILDYLTRDPRAASAETNALDRLLEPNDRAVLLYSQTLEGQRCALLIQAHIQKTHRCEIEEVQGLSYAEKGFVQHGLKNFVQKLAKHIRGAKRSSLEPIINATGGFKAEIAYATAVGLVFKTPVCYIHEKFGDIVTLPVTPFGWDSSIFALHQEFFDWIDAEPRPSQEVQSRVAGLPEEIKMLLEEAQDNTTMLSPLGEAYLNAFQFEKETSNNEILLSKKARRDWDNFDSTTQKAYRNVLDGLRLPNRYSRSELKSGGGDALGYPKGHTNERVFFAEENNALYIFEFTKHGRDYAQFCTNGLRWLEYPRQEFTRLEL